MTVDKTTQGQPAKVSLCFAENQAENPWSAYHVDRGFAPADSTVTVLASEGPHNIHELVSVRAESLMRTIVGAMSHAGHNNIYLRGDIMLVLCPEHARTLANDGWDKEDVRRALWERAGLPAAVSSEEMLHHVREVQPAGSPEFDSVTGRIPLTARAEQIRIVVAGGAGKHSSWLPTFGLTHSGIARIE